MKNKFYLILTTIILLFTACGDNIKEKNISEKENNCTTKNITKESNKSTLPCTKASPKEYNYVFEDLNKNSTTLHVKNDIYNFTNIKQPIVMVSFFSTWCPPCRGQIPHLTNLQKKFKNNLFILSALVHDDEDDEKLKKFTIAEKVMFFVSNNQKENLRFAHMITPKLGLKKDFPLPLMILFVNGKYFTHYGSIMPEEMIESDIKQLLEKIKK